LALTSPTSAVGIVHSRTKNIKFFLPFQTTEEKTKGSELHGSKH
jgi:hypothetical protein